MPQIRAVSLYCYLDIASSVGIDGPRILADAGISASALEDPEARLPAAAAISVLERSAELAGLDSFGIRMAQFRSFASLGPISLLLERLDNVREVVSTLAELRRRFNDVLFVSTEQLDESVAATFSLMPPHGSRQAADLTVGMAYLALTGASRGRWRPECVHFTHSAPKDRAPFARFFKAPVSFDDTFNGFSFSRAGLDIALPLADRDMAQNARRLLNLISIPDNHASASDRTRQAITILLPNGKATIGNVAALLNRAPRTLQRQLQSEHQSFASLLNEVKRDLAVRHLSDSPQNLISIAAALGYANSGSFSRWFAREFGRPPSGWRTSELSSGLNGEHEVIFSQRDGEVWASWLNRRPPVNLGAHEMVVAMMANYIEQSKAAERLLNISARMGSGLKR